MKISAKELKLIFDSLVSKIEMNLGEKFEFEDQQEYYWDVLENEIFNIDNEIENNDFSIGQISEDWNELKRLIEDEEPISYDLIRLAYLLIAIRKRSIGKW